MDDEVNLGELSDSAYALNSPAEIMGVLREIIRGRALLQLRVPPGVLSVVTTLLHVDPQGLVLDDPGEVLARRIGQDDIVLLDTSLDQVRVHFRLAGARLTEYQSHPALRAPLPGVLLRMQRRETFRVNTPVARPVLCHIAAGAHVVALPLDDIGAGGVGLFDDAGDLAVAVGAVLRGCRLDLPGVGEVMVDLRVVQRREVPLPNGKVRNRLGCTFDGDTGRSRQHIQRYVSQLEREMIARQRGLA